MTVGFVCFLQKACISFDEMITLSHGKVPGRKKKKKQIESQQPSDDQSVYFTNDQLLKKCSQPPDLQVRGVQ